MSWGAIVVGVDASPAAAGAAALAQRIALAAQVPCALVHGTRDVWAPLAAVSSDAEVSEMRLLQLAVDRQLVVDALRAAVEPRLLEQLTVRSGSPATVLGEAVAERRAGLLVVGGKHHTPMQRWLGGSTSLEVVRSSEVPVLVTAGAPGAINRILVALDLSSAARPTLGVAQRFAGLTGAQIRVLSVLEPLPVLPAGPPVDSTGYYELAHEALRRDIWSHVQPDVVRLVRHGGVLDTLAREAAEWSADVIVVGSHGRGWAQRILLGSVAEGLLNQLPTSVLVAPVGRAMAALRKRGVTRGARPSRAVKNRQPSQAPIAANTTKNAV
jgi:nucleotide-binding universal stress UspA family protein